MDINKMNMMPVIGRGQTYCDRMLYHKYRLLFILSKLRSGQAAGEKLARLCTAHQAFRNERKKPRTEAAAKPALRVTGLKSIAALALPAPITRQSVKS